VVAAIALLVIAAGAFAAGAGYVRTARRMRHYRSTPGRVLSRDVAAVRGGTREGVWGRGGGWAPKITYRYSVAGQELTGDRVSYARRGLRRRLAEEQAAAFPDEVEVWFDPDDPSKAFLERHSPGLGWILVAGGGVVALGVIAWLVSGG
jgi:uncharacterized protein DUF3592